MWNVINYSALAVVGAGLAFAASSPASAQGGMEQIPVLRLFEQIQGACPMVKVELNKLQTEGSFGWGSGYGGGYGGGAYGSAYGGGYGGGAVRRTTGLVMVVIPRRICPGVTGRTAPPPRVRFVAKRFMPQRTA
jgi:hypothetical protein